MTFITASEGGIPASRKVRAVIGALVLGLIAIWLFLPGLGLTAIVREWIVDLWNLLRGTPLVQFIPSGVLSLPALMVFLASVAAVVPRSVFVAWRTFAFMRRRRKLAQTRAMTAVIA